VWHVCDFLLQAVRDYRVSTDNVKIKRRSTAAGLQYLSRVLVKNCGKYPVTRELCPTCVRMQHL